MAVGPINIARVSHGLRADQVLGSLQRTQRDLFESQSRISLGRRFTLPSEDPRLAARTVDLTEAISRQAQFRSNLQQGDNLLSAADDALSQISSLLIDASAIASQNVSNLTSADERAAEALLIGGIREELQIIGNTRFQDRFLFGGRETLSRPFVDSVSGIAYVGDTGERFTRIDGGLSAAVNVPGHLLYGALSQSLLSDVDLTPTLSPDTRLTDLRGAAESGVRAGRLIINEPGGAGVVRISVAGTETVGDLVARINQAAADAASGFTAELTDVGINIKPGSTAITITDSGGTVAADLGIRTTEATTDVIEGQDLLPRLTRLTRLDALRRGAGIDQESGMVISNGTGRIDMDVSQAITVQDLINALQTAGVFLMARINDAGTGIDVFNRVSGAQLTIGENGGTTAADLGIRTFDRATPLDRLNFGRGIDRAQGVADFLITAKDGSSFEVNVDDAETVGEVIDLVNAAAEEAGVGITAGFAAVGNGLSITDTTGGAGDLAVTKLNLSDAAAGLGIEMNESGTSTEIIGDDVHKIRNDGIIDALADLQSAMERNDTQGMTLAAERIEELRKEVIRIHGVVGARAQTMRSNRQQMEDAIVTTDRFLSEVRDIDYAEAVTEMQKATTQLQANLQTSAIILNLTLLDFLR